MEVGLAVLSVFQVTLFAPSFGQMNWIRMLGEAMLPPVLCRQMTIFGHRGKNLGKHPPSGSVRTDCKYHQLWNGNTVQSLDCNHLTLTLTCQCVYLCFFSGPILASGVVLWLV